MMNTKYKLQLTNIERIARQFVEEQSDGRVFAFYGQMGAGKTTLLLPFARLSVSKNLSIALRLLL